MATAQIPWNDGSGHNMSVEWDGTQDGEIKISSPTNPSLTEQRTKSIQVQTTAGSPQVTRTIIVVQEAAVYTYEYSVIASSSDILPASGGSVTYTAQLKTYLQGDLLKTETVTPVCRIVSGTGFSASGNRVTAANRGTEYSASQRSAQVAVEFVAPETGETLSETATVNQAANSRVIVYSKPNITDVSANDIPASGGSISSANVSYSQSRHYYYDSGATENLSALTTGGTINYGDPVTASSRGTTVGDRQFAGTLTFTVSMNGQTSAEQDVSVYQEANEITGEYLVDNDGAIDLGVDDYTTFTNPTHIDVSSDYNTGHCRYGIGLEFTSGSKYQPASYSEAQQMYPDWVADVESNIDSVFKFIGDDVICIDEAAPDISTPSGVNGKFGAYRDCAVAENEGSEARTGYFQWRWSHISTFTTPKVTVSQDAGAYLNVSPTSLSFEAAGGTKTITIDTNESWTIE